MQVKAISSTQALYVSKNSKPYSDYQKIQTKNLGTDAFQPSFCGYEKVLEETVSMAFTKDYQVEKSFEKLIKELIARTDLKRAPAYYDIISVYTERGFMGLLNELWKAYPQEKIAKILDGKEYKAINLVTDPEGIGFELFHFGKFGSSADNPNDIKVIFRDLKKKSAMEYSLNKKGELEICQTSSDRTLTTGFHLSTGNKRFEVFQPRNGNPETTYYNKNGEESFWKNFFWGGTAIITQ
ncbi:hypothetical protein IJ541_03565 [bacterium]|nr:hypothetical protein [bacterium]